MDKKIISFALVVFFLFLLSTQVWAADTLPINDLIEKSRNLDGQQVTVQGEAVGEPLYRGDYCWVNINDGTNAIGIWMQTEDAGRVTSYGNYKTKGDTLTITGIFRRACQEHGGEADIHMNELTISQKGYPLAHFISPVKIILAVILFIAACGASYVIYRIRVQRHDEDEI